MGTIIGHKFIQIMISLHEPRGEVGSCTVAATLTKDIVVSLVSDTMESGFEMAPPDQSMDDGPWDPPDIWEETAQCCWQDGPQEATSCGVSCK